MASQVSPARPPSQQGTAFAPAPGAPRNSEAVRMQAENNNSPPSPAQVPASQVRVGDAEPKPKDASTVIRLLGEDQCMLSKTEKDVAKLDLQLHLMKERIDFLDNLLVKKPDPRALRVAEMDEQRPFHGDFIFLPNGTTVDKNELGAEEQELREEVEHQKAMPEFFRFWSMMSGIPLHMDQEPLELHEHLPDESDPYSVDRARTRKPQYALQRHDRTAYYDPQRAAPGGAAASVGAGGAGGPLGHLPLGLGGGTGSAAPSPAKRKEMAKPANMLDTLDSLFVP